MENDQDAGGSTLAGAISGPLAAGNLEGALQSARTFFSRHPGDGDAKRVVESLELLIAQVWFGGAEDGETPELAYAQAAERLALADLDGALAWYEELAGTARADRLALHVRVVEAAASGAPLPAPAAAAPAPSFDDQTRVAEEGELPLGAFDEREPTANVLPSEATRYLMVGEYEIVDDEPPPPQAEPEADERTRIFRPAEIEEPPEAPRVIDDGTREVTRIAGAGELPIEELRRQIAKESDEQVDELLESVEKSAPRPSLPIEPSLVLDITVDELERASAPAPAPRGPAVPPPPQVAKEAGERPAMPPEPPSQPALATVEAPAGAAPSRSEALPFASSAAPTTPEGRPHRPSSPDAPRESAPALGSVPAPPPAPPPAPESIRAVRPDLLSSPPDASSIDLALAPTPSAPFAPPRPGAAPAPIAPQPVPAPIAPAPAPIAPEPPAPPAAVAPALAPPAPIVPAPAPAAPPAPDAAPPAPSSSAPAPTVTEPGAHAPPAHRAAPPAPAAPPAAPFAPPPAPPPAPESIRASRPDLLAAPPPTDNQTSKSNTEDPPAPVRGPVVPPPPRGPAVPPPPPIGGASTAATPPVEIPPPLDTGDVVLPPSAWTIREPGKDADAGDEPFGDASWSGVRVTMPDPPPFEPEAGSVDADTWGADEATVTGEATPEHRAEAAAARGELAEALRIYQEEAVKRPGEPELWERVAELARMLQERGR